MELESGSHFVCPGRGLHAVDFASGWIATQLKKSFEIFRQLLFVDISGLDPCDRDKVMGDYDLGVASILYQAGLKFAVWLQLPLKLAGVLNDSVHLAREAVAICFQLWEKIKELPRRVLHPLVVELFLDADFVSEMIRFQNGAMEWEDCKLLQAKLLWMALVRVNELSVERLHRLGSLETSHATYLSMSYVSISLRGPEIHNSPHWDLEAVANAASQVKTPRQIVERFAFQKHPITEEAALKNTARTGEYRNKYSGQFPIPHKELRQMFYRNDKASMFQKHEELAKVLTRQAEDQRRQFAKLYADPLAELRPKNVEPERKFDGMMCNYALKHWKGLAKPGFVYVTPMPSEREPAFTDVMASMAPVVEESSGIMDDAWPVETSVLVQTGVEQTLHAFRIVHASPSNQKIFRNPNCSLRADHVAIANYRVKEVTIGESTSMEVEGAMHGIVDEGVRLLGLQQFLGAGVQRLCKEFLKGVPSSSSSYWFSGVSLPEVARSRKAVQLVTDMINSDAFPGPNCLFHLGVLDPEERLTIMDIYAQESLVQVFASTVGKGYQITDVGASKLRYGTKVDKFEPALLPRQGLAIDDYTTWEYLWVLRSHGWKGLPAVGRMPKTLTLKDAVPDAERLFYYNSNKLDLAHSYLQCLVDMPKVGVKRLHICCGNYAYIVFLIWGFQATTL